MSVRSRTAVVAVSAAGAAVALAVVLAVVLAGAGSAPGGPSGALEPVPGGAEGNGAGSASGSAPATSPGTAQASPGAPGQPSGSGTSGASGTDTGATAPLGEAASPSSGAGPNEQPASGPGDQPLLDRAPDRTESANGRIVGSFPAALRPSPRSRVVSSSVAPSGRRVQASLVVRDRAPARLVLRRYHLRLAGHGFTELPIRSVPGSTSAVFRNGQDSVVVTVTGGRQPSYSVVASLVAG